MSTFKPSRQMRRMQIVALLLLVASGIVNYLDRSALSIANICRAPRSRRATSRSRCAHSAQFIPSKKRIWNFQPAPPRLLAAACALISVHCAQNLAVYMLTYTRRWLHFRGRLWPTMV